MLIKWTRNYRGYLSIEYTVKGSALYNRFLINFYEDYKLWRIWIGAPTTSKDAPVPDYYSLWVERNNTKLGYNPSTGFKTLREAKVMVDKIRAGVVPSILTKG